MLCECRILYRDAEICGFIEDGPHRMIFAKTHVKLRQRASAQNVKEAIEDVVSMVDLTEKK